MVGLTFVLALLLQTPRADCYCRTGRRSAACRPNPIFTGFIESRDGGEPVLMYRQKNFHGELNAACHPKNRFGNTGVASLSL